VFAPGVSIEDDMAVLVRYAGGATMTYHLTAYSPWEGYRVMFNGSRGRIELEVVENDRVGPDSQASVRLRVRPFWAPPRDIPLGPAVRDGHGGADERMLAQLLDPAAPPDELGRTATERDGARALLIGLAANESIATGQPVDVAGILETTP
jgi:predicted dehydrogenase